MRLRSKLPAHNAYALIALLFGGIFAVITPPFGAGDETAHYERTYEVATGAPLGAAGITAGMQTFFDDAFGKVKSEQTFSLDDYRRWSNIELEKETITPYPEPIRIVLRLHNPLSYIHMAPLMWVGLKLNFPPLALFYLCRLAALFAGVALVRQAIKTTPVFKLQFAAIALLPTAVVFFGAANIESLLIGLCFYFVAMLMAQWEEPDSRISRRDLCALIVTAFFIHQFKSAYFLVPALAFLLPASKFASNRSRLISMLLIFVPGFIVNLAWVTLVKEFMIDGLIYSTSAEGNVVDPSAQLHGLIEAPFSLFAVLFRTLTSPTFIGWTFQSFIGVGGWTNIAMPPWAYMAAAGSTSLLWMSGPVLRSVPHGATVAMGAVFSATFLGVLSLLYLQWTGVGAAQVEGFQGRYLLSIAPLMFAAAPYRFSLLAAERNRWLIFVGGAAISLAAMTGAIAARYYQI